MLHVFIARKTGTIGGNLVEHSAGLAKVDRAEVVAIDHRRNGHAKPLQPVMPFPMPLVVGSPKGNMMDTADSLAGGRKVRPHLEMHLGTQPAWTDLKDRGLARLVVEEPVLTGASESQRMLQKLRARLE